MSQDTVFVTIPFYEDFSDYFSGTPDTSKWQTSNGVFINNNYGLGILTTGVATFDGQDSIGTPYNLDALSIVGAI